VAIIYSTSLPIEQKIVHYLFDDIARLPIITNRSQELWLGIQLRAAGRLEALLERLAPGGETAQPLAGRAKEAPDLLPKVVDSCFAASRRLTEAAAESRWFPYIDMTEWARELSAARHDIYSLRRSRLRQLLDGMAKEPDPDEIDPILREIVAVIELQALLPDELLKQFIQRPLDHADSDYDRSTDCLPLPWENTTYMAWVKEQSTRAKNQLVTGYLRYALRIARNHGGDKLEYPDLVQHAFIGLLKGAERFDYRVNVRFGTYATTWMWQSVSRALADESSLVRVPVHVREKLDKLGRIVTDCDTGVGDPLSDPGILREAGFLDEADLQDDRSDEDDDNTDGLDKLHLARRRARRLVLMTLATLSFDEDAVGVAAPDGDETQLPLKERLPAELPDDHAFLRPAIRRLLGHLTERQRDVITLRFGLTDGREHTLAEIGQTIGVSRERVRQIEAMALRLFENMLIKKQFPIRRDVLFGREAWSLPQPRWPGGDPIEAISPPAASAGDEYLWLDRLLGRVPRSSWHAPGVRGAGTTMTRAEQLAEALSILGAPSHHAEIVAQTNELSDARFRLENAAGYTIMAGEERSFILLGNGVFSLVEWEKARAGEQEPVLPFCPLALPDPPGFEGALFESVFVGHELLRQEPTAIEFLAHMLRWAESDPLVKPWLRQGILSVYYLLGLVPYTFICAGKNPRLRSTLPHEDIQTLRRYCLEMMTTRLAAMPEFWWLLRNTHPARPVDVGEQLAEVHPHGLDDAQQRLYLLNSLGATTRLPGGYYRLTTLGEACAAGWARSPGAASAHVIEIAEGDSGLLDWGFW